MPVCTQSRAIEHIVRGVPTSDGAGVKLTRVLTQSLQQRLDPFLMLDEFGSDQPDDYLAGFPSHPHRGFETVTYMLEGRMRHRDSVGNEGVLEPGAVQWMTAGRGIVHSEMPEQQAGRMRGFQLWINLPASEKMCPPRYRNLSAEALAMVAPVPGCTATVIAGRFADANGPVRDISADPLLLDLAFSADAALFVPLAPGHNAFVYVYEGEVLAGATAQCLQTGQLAVLGNQADAAGIALSGTAGARALVAAGRPFGEPIVQWGPFVMNSRAEIEQAMADYHNGTLA